MATAKVKYRSGLERVAAGAIKRSKLEFDYEKLKLYYIVPAQKKFYLPDWSNKNNIILEAKGRFTSQDRKKMLLVKEQHPDKTIIMIFGQPNNRLSKKSSTTYADWCDKNGILWCGIDDFEEDAAECLYSITKNLGVGKPKIYQKKKSKPFLATLQK